MEALKDSSVRIRIREEECVITFQGLCPAAFGNDKVIVQVGLTTGVRQAGILVSRDTAAYDHADISLSRVDGVSLCNVPFGFCRISARYVLHYGRVCKTVLKVAGRREDLIDIRASGTTVIPPLFGTAVFN